MAITFWPSLPKKMASSSLLLLLPLLLPSVSSHGRLTSPPSRASMWRYGFNTPVDYDDTQGWCGGFQRQWEVNGGRCGVCGDPWDEEVREHEAPGGRYATGTLAATYTAGQRVNISVEVTANHRGHFTFALCPASGEGDPSQDWYEPSSRAKLSQ